MRSSPVDNYPRTQSAIIPATSVGYLYYCLFLAVYVPRTLLPDASLPGSSSSPKKKREERKKGKKQAARLAAVKQGQADRQAAASRSGLRREFSGAVSMAVDGRREADAANSGTARLDVHNKKPSTAFDSGLDPGLYPSLDIFPIACEVANPGEGGRGVESYIVQL
ncbi:hypothetical protein, variant [Blastomyces dermatitidis ATCC 26199]|nr:hypothetical protein BDFG_04164 [Blastomyces dermatitidis ATCC 26199]EQL33890.1 hypothetical protein, variant [Blastomyces dermatitidis ATCC 26199]